MLTYNPDNNQSMTMTSAKALADGSSHKVTVAVSRSQTNTADTWQVGLNTFLTFQNEERLFFCGLYLI